MVLQSVIVPNDVCDIREIYFHIQGEVALESSTWKLEKGTYLDTYTYMNLFDAGTWEKYTGMHQFKLCMKVSGKGRITLYQVHRGIVKTDQFIDIDEKELCDVCILFSSLNMENQYYFSVSAESKMCISDVCFASLCEYGVNSVQLGIVICTYKRNRQLNDILEKLQSSRFFDETSNYFHKMNIFVVDNASEMPEMRKKHLSVYHNSNTGGSGGFSRGMKEIRNVEKIYGITNVILMDDDVEVLPETFYRIYALLSFIKSEYKEEAIAGRMFRRDQKEIQYTAAEIWNDGNIKHIGWNCDMTQIDSLNDMNCNEDAQYGGWWLCCYPMDFVRNNSPFPFFIHCDDVEYGLRHGREPIILNGVQVWHETYEYRLTPKILYYDIRNSMVVNALYENVFDVDSVISAWKQRMDSFHNAGKQTEKYLCMLALWHFNTGKIFVRRKGKLSEVQIWLSKREKLLKVITPFCHRIAEKYVKNHYIDIVNQYREKRKEICQ